MLSGEQIFKKLLFFTPAPFTYENSTAGKVLLYRIWLFFDHPQQAEEKKKGNFPSFPLKGFGFLKVNC